MDKMAENDKEFAKHLDDIIREGPLYQSLGLSKPDPGKPVLDLKNKLKNQLLLKVAEKQTENFKKQHIETGDPRFCKDYERSTWWEEDDNLNYKMKKWVQNQEYVEQYREIKSKKKANKLSKKKF
mmetsp:Transcript_35371/g.54138  ORF Transcript_35371/g.54138 Transcript_35371/m.54138 type:complete len:125 (+) Transcript_35371:5318-5692(+)